MERIRVQPYRDDEAEADGDETVPVGFAHPGVTAPETIPMGTDVRISASSGPTGLTNANIHTSQLRV